jgi:hypothetical protein
VAACESVPKVKTPTLYTHATPTDRILGNPQGSVQYFRPSSSSWTKYYFPFSGASMVTAIMEVNGVPYIYATSRDYGNSIQKLMRARMYIN